MMGEANARDGALREKWCNRNSLRAVSGCDEPGFSDSGGCVR
jgi:hypothetical protein